MKKILMAAMMGAGGLLVAAPNALAQECGIRPTRTSSYTTSRTYRPTYTTSRTYRVPYFHRTASTHRSHHRTTRTYDHRHCNHCVAVQKRYWASTTRYERVFAGYDHCGRAIYRTVSIPCGSWKTKTVYYCR